ncbi:MAG: hypothetical protein WD342_19480 [Verrucomicrobiales bacterium]
MTTKITQGDFSDDGGVGNVNPAMIRERAAQLAVSDGRTEDEISQTDMDQAEKELRADLRSSEQKRLDAEQAGRNDAGGAETEALVEQGIEEAVHDEMLESGKETTADAEEESREGRGR